MESEWNLSDKILSAFSSQFGNSSCIGTEDVREFIKKVKEKGLNKTGKWILIDTEDFDKLAGDKLI